MTFQSFWQKKHKAGDDCTFGVNESRVWDAKECKTLIYILHQHNHFTLLVGYTDENRWEFYNSSESDKYGLVVYEGFVSVHSILVDFFTFHLNELTHLIIFSIETMANQMVL